MARFRAPNRITSRRQIRLAWQRLVPGVARVASVVKAVPVSRLALIAVALVVLPASIVTGAHLRAARYHLSSATQALVGPAIPTLDKQLGLDKKTSAYQYNAAAQEGIKAISDSGDPGKQIGGSKYYGVTLASRASKGQTFTDAATQLSFTLVPRFGQMAGEHSNGHVVYPFGHGQVVYTLKDNGLKEDVVLTKPTDHLALSYDLKLPPQLSARLLPDGSVGVYSANPALFGNITYGSSTDQVAVQKARSSAVKDNLVFQLPAPTIIQSGASQKGGQARFSLSGNILTVTATGLRQLHYPLSIDPSVVITTANAFTLGNNEDSNAVITSGSVTRNAISGGTVNSSVGAWHFTDNSTDRGTSQGAGSGQANGLNTARTGAVNTVYNGYIYTIAGSAGGGQVATVEYASINSNGTVGTWNFTSSLAQSRTSFSVATYNGYIYVMGGAAGGGTAFDSVEYAQINSNGTLGAWGAPKMAGCVSSCGDILPTKMWSHASAVYGGYIYALEGCVGISAAICPSGMVNSSYTAHINADGTLGSWSAINTTGLTKRKEHAAVAYNGFLYVIGGCESQNSVSKACNQSPTPDDVQYAKLDPTTGAVGDWSTATTTFAFRSSLEATVSNGYMYVVGGGLTNDVLYAPIYANGSIGAWNTTLSYTNSRTNSQLVTYNGYLYIVAGCVNSNVNCSSGIQNDVQYAKIDTATGGFASPSFTSPTSPGSAASGQAFVSYGGYLYVMGGWNNNHTSYLATVQYTKLNADGSFISPGISGCSGATWCTTASFNTGRAQFAAAAANGYLYISGGNTGGLINCADVQYAAASTADGSLSTWTDIHGGSSANACANTSNPVTNNIDFTPTAPSGAPVGEYLHSSLTYNGYLYLIGGMILSNSDTVPDIQYALICTGSNSGVGGCGATAGTVGTFTQSSHPMGTKLSGMAAFVYGGNLYVAGGKTTGNNTTAISTISYAPFTSTGDIGSWSTAGNLPGSTARVGLGATIINDYLYAFGGFNGTNNGLIGDKVWSVQMNTNGTITTANWAQSSVALTTTNSRAYAGVLSYNANLYVVGGCQTTPSLSSFCASGDSLTDTEYMGINNGGGGVSGTWSQSSNLIAGTGITAGYAAQAVTYHGYVYLLGGCTTTPTVACTSGTSQVLRAPLTASGDIGSWVKDAQSMPNANYGFSAALYNGRIYVMSGNTGASSLTETDYATIDPITGAISGTWTRVLSAPWTGRIGSSAFAYNGYLYMTGGYDGTTYQSQTWHTPINSDGSIGTWTTTTTTFTAGRWSHVALVNNGYAYMIGGLNNGVLVPGVQYAPIQANGDISTTWQYTSAFNIPRYGFNAAVYDGYLYLYNGITVGPSFPQDVQRAPINSNGSLGNWEVSATHVSGTLPNVSGAAGIVANGYLYTLGGSNSGTISTYTLSAPLQVIPREAHYSRVVDLGKDVEQTRVVLSGATTDNGLGSNVVSLAATTAPSSTGVFGTTSLVGGTVFGGPMSYKSLSTSIGRYAFLEFVIDDSGSASFPDASQTSVTGLGVYFHTNPKNRLRGGQTFTGTNPSTAGELDTEGSP